MVLPNATPGGTTKPPVSTEEEYSSYDSASASKSHTSTAEEIQGQHAAAEQRVHEGLIFSIPSRHEEIPLLEKRQPVNARSIVGACWSSRGYANVTALQNLVRNGYNRKYDLRNIPRKATSHSNGKPKNHGPLDTPESSVDQEEEMNYWDPIMASTHNVYIRRPSHDAWGIPKIVLIYSDDFLQEIYDFPWLQSVFLPALQPILDVLNLPLHRVVRLLLASLPSQSTIPVHFDTGEWVKHTHRVHVPILVQDVNKIVFCCGPTLEDMATIQCQPGHVFEINNQAQHCVSNCDTDYRVHLILDYVDENHTMPPRDSLVCGETVVQTRRSIDRMIHYGKRPTPTFIILGAQKAGTTYLFELIMQHPLCIKPKNNRRETHCLDWNWNTKKCTSRLLQQQWCQSFFYHEELQRHPSCCTGDSTPSYLMDHVRVIPRLQQAYSHCREMKFFILCRHPVLRALSHYAMVTSDRGTPAQLKARGSEWRQCSFEQVVLMDFLRMHQCGLLPYWTMDGLEELVRTMGTSNTASAHSIPWDQFVFNPKVFESFSGSPEEAVAWTCYVQQHVPLHTGSYGLLSRGVYSLQIGAWLKQFEALQFLIFKLEAMTSSDDTAYATLREVWKHIEVPFYELPVEAVRQPQNARDYSLDLSGLLHDFLRRFYEPHNQRLHAMIRALSHLNKEDVWERHWGPSSTSLWS